ncbi:flagellar hook protein FlgE [Magnetococcales bacterium HHB-1]
MSIMQAMLSGSSALTNYSEAMTVIGNNLANANTTAFKGSRATFEDVLIQTVGVSGTRAATQVGTGVGLASVQQNMSQGSFNTTSSVLDLSIDGKGFFMVKDPDPGSSDPTVLLPPTPTNEDTFYTRAGDFKQTKDGDVVTNSGLVLQGWQLDPDTSLPSSSSTTDINLNTFDTNSPQATGAVSVGLNLSADAEVITNPLYTTYDPNNPATYNHSTTVRVYDDQGVGHNVDLHFKKLAVGDGTSYTNTTANTTSISFDSSNIANGSAINVTLTPLNSSTAGSVTYSTTSAASATDTLDLSTATATSGTLTADVKYAISYSSTAGDVLGVSGNDGSVGAVANEWAWHVAVMNEELDSTQQGTGDMVALDLTDSNVQDELTGAGYTSGRLSFTTAGLLEKEGSTPITFKFAGQTSSSTPSTQEILFDFGSATGDYGDSTNDWNKNTSQLTYDTSVLTADTGNSGADGAVQYSGEFATLKLSQDGYSTGYLESLQVSDDGTIYGAYTNGQTQALYQVALVDFENEMALEQIGANLFGETHLSGQALVGQPKSGRLGNLVSFSLEQSNVDMSNEFVRMISTQRAFQANSRIVTVSDGMIEELISLKR